MAGPTAAGRLAPRSDLRNTVLMQPAVPDKPRIALIDVARGAALVAMAIYHLTWDLEFFGYIPHGTATEGGWAIFARSIASSFLFLVGVSLYLAHGDGIRWRSFAVRLAMIAAAAALITVATLFAVPDAFIFFGILHQIALASLLGLAFLRLPAVLTLALAVAVIAAPHFLRTPFFDHPAWWWVGLSTSEPPANDYVPVLPWFGAVLLGIGATKLARALGLLVPLARPKPGAWSRPLTLAGRHGLSFYLLHQPVLIACVWLFAQAWPPAAAVPETRFTQACHDECAATRDDAFCTRYCACVLDGADSEGRLETLFDERPDGQTQQWLNGLAAQCMSSAEQDPEGDADE